MAKPQPVYRVDRATSKRRAKRLQTYLTKEVWDPTTRRSWRNFICASKEDCKESADNRGASFHAAQGHSVGRCYDLSTVDGLPLRVLIVPMEAGGGDTFFSVEGRTNETRKSARLPFQKRFRGDEARNPHMKGVTLALRLALGLPFEDRLGKPFIHPEDDRVSFTDDTTDDLFECFAMANLLLCSAVLKAGSQKSLATPVMRESCARHLVKTISILQPTLVISQGWGLVDTLWDSLGVTNQVNLNVDDCYLADCNLNGNPFAWVALYHPTRFWSTINQPYFQDTVVPAIKAARKRAMKLAQTV
jgi:hypothetical protein